MDLMLNAYLSGASTENPRQPVVDLGRFPPACLLCGTWIRCSAAHRSTRSSRPGRDSAPPLRRMPHAFIAASVAEADAAIEVASAFLKRVY
jgi:hypothetical protein